MASPAIEFDFKTVVFSFLPHQIKDLDALIKNLETAAPEIIGVATYEQCKEFTETLSKYQKFSDIRNVGAAIHSMVQSVNEKMDNVGYDENEEWTYLAKLFGSNAIWEKQQMLFNRQLKKRRKKGLLQVRIGGSLSSFYVLTTLVANNVWQQGQSTMPLIMTTGLGLWLLWVQQIKKLQKQ